MEALIILDIFKNLSCLPRQLMGISGTFKDFNVRFSLILCKLTFFYSQPLHAVLNTAAIKQNMVKDMLRYESFLTTFNLLFGKKFVIGINKLSVTFDLAF